MKGKPIVALTMASSLRKRVFAGGNLATLKRIARKVVMNPKDGPPDFKGLARLVKDADVVITSWGSPRMTPEVLDVASKLKLIAHSAGSVKSVTTEAVWERGIRVTSCAPAIAVAVAETTLTCILAGLKGLFPIRQNLRKTKDWWGSRKDTREMHRKTIGIIAASHVGRNVIRLLKGFDVDVLLYDPYVSAGKAKALGATKVPLATLLRKSHVVSLHAPSTDETRHMLGAKQFKLMKDDAVFVNTARGSCVDEKALVRELKKGRFFAFLDVTDPEPPVKGSPLYKLDNVVLTPHIAGTVDDYTPLGALAVEEVKRFAAGKPQRFPIRLEMLKSIG